MGCVRAESSGWAQKRQVGLADSLLMTYLCHQKQNTSWLFAKQRTFPYFFLTNEPCSKCFQKHLWKVHRHFQATSEPFLKLFSLCMILNPCSSISPSMVHYTVLWNHLGYWLGVQFLEPILPGSTRGGKEHHPYKATPGDTLQVEVPEPQSCRLTEQHILEVKPRLSPVYTPVNLLRCLTWVTLRCRTA